MTKKLNIMTCFLSLITLSASHVIATENLPFQLLYRMNGPSYIDALGSAVATAGDIDGDGKTDFIFGAPNAQGAGPITYRPGAAFVYSSANGSLLYRKNGSENMDGFGNSVAGVGDVNGDGRDDFIVGAPETDPQGSNGAGSVHVYSGSDGSLLYEIDGSVPNMSLGVSVAGVGDINNDSKRDFIVGAYFADPNGMVNAGSAFVFSGADGSVIYQINGDSADEYLGISVGETGDVNGDGKPDFIIGAYLANPGGLGSTGSAFVYSGNNGSLIFRLNGDSADDNFGRSVNGTGDIDKDGKADFIVGAPHANPSGLNDAGSAFVYSGATGGLLFRVNGTAIGDCLGSAVAIVGDVDADGTTDFAVGAPCAKLGYALQAGYAAIYSGVDGTLLFQANGTPTELEYADGMGESVSTAGDVNGDGKADFIIGDPLRNWLAIGAGSAFIYGLVSTDAPEEKQNRPNQFELFQNYPNPFNPTTTIRYYLPKREKVTLEIFNLLGEQVKLLLEEEQPAGEHMAVWDGKDKNGKSLPSGIYLYRLKSKDFLETKKMIFLK